MKRPPRQRIKTTGGEGDAVPETAAPPTASAAKSCKVSLDSALRVPAAYAVKDAKYHNAAIVLASKGDAVQITSDGRSMLVTNAEGTDGVHHVPLGSVTVKTGVLTAETHQDLSMTLRVPKGKEQQIVAVPKGSAEQLDDTTPVMAMPLLHADLPNEGNGLVWRSFPADKLIQVLQQVSGGSGLVGIAFCPMGSVKDSGEHHYSAIAVSLKGLGVVMPVYDAALSNGGTAPAPRAGETAAAFASRMCKLWWKFFPGHRRYWDDRPVVRRCWHGRYGTHTRETEWATEEPVSYKLIEQAARPRRWIGDPEGGE